MGAYFRRAYSPFHAMMGFVVIRGKQSLQEALGKGGNVSNQATQKISASVK